MPRNGKPRNGEQGFTLIEVLVVIMICGILAAIAIPAFLSQRMKAQDADAKSSAVIATRVLEEYHQDHDGFAGVNAAALVDIEPSLASARNLVVAETAAGYRLTVDSASGGDGGGPFIVERSAPGQTDRTCGAPGHGGCPRNGRW
ncbi:MAG TPA: prepilin-type N-terminal cleavage/methylation domain-containing protein [Solirubrobacteraceae bacterium]|nr:prepilin-type N-terminal cleavage/methylation domain-containing protein [Solirubrobacteraceae bacterium]